MPLTSDQSYFGLPGVGAALETIEGEFSWGRFGLQILLGMQIDGAARDSGNSPTFNLRAGLLLGKITSTGRLTNWSATATDGSQFVYGILVEQVRMEDRSGANVQRFAPVAVGGPIQAAKLFGLNGLARAQMRGRFTFDDDPGDAYAMLPWRQEVAQVSNYSVLVGDVGTLFTNTGAVGSVTFTLPAIAVGLMYEFLVVANQTVTVASNEGSNIVGANSATYSSLAFSTGGDKIGGMLRVYSNAAGTKWYYEKICSNALTMS